MRHVGLRRQHAHSLEIEVPCWQLTVGAGGVDYFEHLVVMLAGQTTSELKQRKNAEGPVDTSSSSPTKTSKAAPLCSRSLLHPRRMLIISVACNVLWLGAWLGFRTMTQLSSIHCQSNLNGTALNESLSTAVVGQTAAMQYLRERISWYTHNATVTCLSGRENPGIRPLILAIHGGHGTGKTYVIGLLMKHFGAQCSRQFVVPLHFPFRHSNSMSGFYRNQVATAMQVPATLGSCLIRLLVLEDVDSIPEGSLRGLVTGMLTWSEAYVPTVVILTSSLGSQLIENYFINTNCSRHDFDEILLSQLTAKAAKAASTPWGDTVVRGNLVSHTIYLLPLELTHLQQCIEMKLRERGIKQHDWSQIILKQSVFVERGNKKLAKYGCKRVESDITYWSGL